MKRFYILFLSALIFAPSLLFGATNIDDNHIIFTWGYGEVANDILQAIKGITSGADYMVKIVMAIAFFTFAIKKVMDERTSPIFEFGKMIFIMVIIWQCFLRAPNDAQHRYMIHDNVTGKDYIVSQVPLGIGLTFSFMSRMEDSITKAMEKFYSTPQSTNFSNAGFGFTLRSTMDLPDLELSQFSPRTQKNLDLFFRNCVIYGMDLNKGRMDTNFRHSDNLYEDLFEIGQGSQLTLYFGEKDKGNIRSCTQAGALIKQDLGSLAPKIETIHARILGSKDENAYRASMQGVWEIFSGQATQARSQLMQAMLINASRDSLINTAKMVGLDPNAVATNTAVAEQNFMSSMLTQGMMAQTYLPLAKAYLTVLIIGLSWIMALLSIMFGDFRHIKMFFTLCIWIVLWTPILSIINYFNDLNLSKSVQVLLDGSLSFSMSNSLSFFKQISEQTNFINYLVMLTPLLAFAVAKASEQGFVSVASSLSQTLQGASRSAGSFTNQQALSTETKIASPLGEEVIAKSAGINSHLGAYNVDGQITKYNTQSTSGNDSYNSEISNSAFTGTNVNGMINGAKLTAGALNMVNSLGESSAKTWNQNFNDTYGQISQSGRNSALSEAKSIMESDNESFRKSFSNNLAQEISKMNNLTLTEQARVSAFAEASTGLKIAGNGITAGVKGEIGVGVALDNNLNAKEQAAYQEAMEKASVKTLAENHNISSEWSKNLSNSDSTAYAKMVGYADSFSQTQSAIQAVTSNNMDNVVNAYARDLATIDNKDFNTLSVAEQNTYFAKAGNQISDMIKNDPASISNYASQYGAGSNVGENTIASPNALNKEFTNVGGNTLLNHNLNQEQVNSRAKDMRSNSNIPNAKDIKEVASGSNINKEVGGKLETADKILNLGLGDKKGI
ncbi:conjugal transfer protein TraG N-terminal domain-containing protein [Campylobacter sp. IFREMER_LSEM_CL1904]|uniref:conjugal transfer protein TraG N-terminal domain-containing protein n=1 Tax=Campylobacter TaxID=194 RepID=UPI00126D9414|nr:MULTISPECIES: conjugal transfer protein TraG N-terminal domain-containing protein [Campylobacter]MCV3428509.1 conjugal transfer protein TraG N-terminal domain-containing protein [Campylobacter sp. IFREMER_LSEM_CL1904]